MGSTPAQGIKFPPAVQPKYFSKFKIIRKEDNREESRAQR